MEVVVHIVDDDPAVCDSLRDLVESVGLHAESYTSPEAFLGSKNLGRPGCMILDLKMPGMNGIELQRELRRQGIEIPIVIITGHGDVEAAVDSFKMGAIDFLRKPFAPERVLGAIRTAIEKDAGVRLATTRRKEALDRLASLSPREKEVLDLVVDGLVNKQIARRLRIAERTVECHRGQVMKKTGANSLPELIKLVLACQAKPGTPGDPIG